MAGSHSEHVGRNAITCDYCLVPKHLRRRIESSCILYMNEPAVLQPGVGERIVIVDGCNITHYSALIIS